MSNTVKIKKKKKKSDLKVNYKLWAIVFGIFVAIIVCLSVWASFHWGVGMGTIGSAPAPESANTGATELGTIDATGNTMVLTPDQLEQMGISLDDIQAEGTESAEEAGASAVEDALGAAVEGSEDAGAAEGTEAAEQ